MKYIIYDDTFPVIISEMSGHNEIRHEGKQPTSAGMLYFKNKKDSCGNDLAIPVCYGKSISLNIESQKIDSYLIAKTMYNFVDSDELKKLCEV